MKSALRILGGAILCPAVLAGTLCWAAATPTHSTGAAVSSAAANTLPLAKYVKSRVNQILSEAQAKGDFDAATKSLGELFDQVIADGRDNDVESFRQADFALRLMTLLSELPTDEQVDQLQYLRDNDELAKAIVFLIRPGRQKPVDAFALLKQLREKKGKLAAQYPNLTAAICVVHATQLRRGINENKATAPDPLDIFDYYVKNENRMFFGVKAVPAELLIWVVDTSSSIEDMTWALNKYAGDKKVGARFFDIKYDYDNFERGTPKKVTTAGFTLPNILKYGGVCADQAYFAVAVGKAIGVPTAYDVGASGEVGHAWVGFLQADHGKGWWNFNTGRYAAYQGVRGTVQDPQTRQNVPDSQVSVLAELIGTRPADRQAAVALTDAAERLIALDKDKQSLDIHFPEGMKITAVRPTPRKADPADAIALIESALKQNAGYPPAWFAVRDLAKDGKLTLKDKRHWADLLQRLGGPKYPDFTLSILAPMIETVSDFKEQNALWNATFNMFQKRFDLAASIRMSQAAAWETQNNTANAGACYMDVIERFANAGPFVIDALTHAEKALKETGHADRIPTLYEQAWSKMTVPREMAAQFRGQSNWYKVGKMYAARLKEAGDSAKSETVLEELKNPPARAAASAK